MDEIKELIELSKVGFVGDLDNFFFSLILVKKIDFLNDLDERNDIEEKRILELESLWNLKYKNIYHTHLNDSYFPPYYDDYRKNNNYPCEWYTFLMEKTPDENLLKKMPNKFFSDKIILNHIKIKLIVLQYFKELSDDFDTKITPLNTIVYQNINKQICDWERYMNMMNRKN